MFELMLFLHLTSLAIWVGSLAAVGILLNIFKKNLDKPGHSAMARTMIRVFNLLTHPSAFLILVTGLVMVITGDYGEDTPFWLFYMQNIGGMIIIAVITVLSIFGKKTVRRLVSAESATGGAKSSETAQAGKSLALMATLMLVTIILVLSVVLVVTYRF